MIIRFFIIKHNTTFIFFIKFSRYLSYIFLIMYEIFQTRLSIGSFSMSFFCINSFFIFYIFFGIFFIQRMIIVAKKMLLKNFFRISISNFILLIRLRNDVISRSNFFFNQLILLKKELFLFIIILILISSHQTLQFTFNLRFLKNFF